MARLEPRTRAPQAQRHAGSPIVARRARGMGHRRPAMGGAD
jgi:hypothetical protein